MALNKKLWNLGNKVVSIARKIDNDFPIPSGCLNGGENIFRDSLLQLLELINEIRLSIQDEEPQEWWDIKVKCNSQEILAIKDHIEALELNYELSKNKFKEVTIN